MRNGLVREDTQRWVWKTEVCPPAWWVLSNLRQYLFGVQAYYCLVPGYNGGMPHVTCIYCGATSAVRFPRDHVIPEAFGKFKHGLTVGCVCGTCNKFFGDELELFLGRDSYAAILRLRYGMKPATEAGDLLSTRLALTVSVPGPWQGARVVLQSDPTGKNLVLQQLPQVALRKQHGDWVWFLERQLTEENLAPFRGLKGLEVKIIGPSDAALERLSQKLQAAGIHFNKQGVLEQPMARDGQVEVMIESQIDQVILRGAGKIALNYFARIKGAEYALRPDFDALRKYVRFGQLPAYPPVVAVRKPILMDDTPRMRQTNGHLLVVEWDRTGLNIVSRVSLFNTLTFLVTLCKHYTGVWHDMRSGHFFDVETRTASPLDSARLVKPVGLA